MKKIHYLAIIFLMVSISGYGQSKQQKEVATAVEVLKKGIVDADKSLLSAIIADQLVYGHSNGKVQNKSEFISGNIKYHPVICNQTSTSKNLFQFIKIFKIIV